MPGTGNITGIEGAYNFFWYTRGTGVYMTTNNGDNWTQVYTASGALNDVDFASQTGCLVGWVVGASGTIAKMGLDSLVGIGNNNNDIPLSFSLGQNYPNPFNPTTKIIFDITSVGAIHELPVKLIVYDAIGREAAVLVNEYKQPGRYTVEFDASSFSSGVYFYKLSAGDFTDTKKMLLIK